MLDPKYNPKFTQAGIERLEHSSFNSASTPWRIKCNGSYVQGRHGKTMWAQRGHAKNSLNHILDYAAFPGYNYPDPRPSGKTLADHLIEEGIVEIVQE